MTGAGYADCNGLYTLSNLTSIWDSKARISQSTIRFYTCYIFKKINYSTAAVKDRFCKTRGLNLPVFTAKTHYREFETNIPKEEIARPRSQFQHSCVCERFIYSHDRFAYPAAGKYVDRSWEYKSVTDT